MTSYTNHLHHSDTACFYVQLLQESLNGGDSNNSNIMIINELIRQDFEAWCKWHNKKKHIDCRCSK